MDDQAKQAIERGTDALAKLTRRLPIGSDELANALNAARHFAYICGYVEFLANRVASLEKLNEHLKATGKRR